MIVQTQVLLSGPFGFKVCLFLQQCISVAGGESHGEDGGSHNHSVLWNLVICSPGVPAIVLYVSGHISVMRGNNPLMVIHGGFYSCDWEDIRKIPVNLFLMCTFPDLSHTLLPY